MRRYRAAVFSALVALTASILQVPTVVAAPRAHAEETPAEAVTEAQASALAMKTGKPVVVASMRNETRDVVANADGTFTLTQHLRPIRVRKDGKWVGADTTLKRQPNGAVAPVAASVGLTFSGGGDGPMVAMSRAGRTMSLWWPGKLPEPMLSGDTATFGDVLPDVDLVLRAEVDGFTHLLRVKTPEAARNPKLAKLAFKLGTSGLSVRADSTGHLEAKDSGTGGAVFEAPVPLMWDSGHPTDEEVAKRKRASVGGQNPVEAPGEGSKKARLKVAVAKDQLTLEPDQNLLTAADTTFPVFIDPQWETKAPAARLMVSSGGWERYNFTGDEGVGRCEVSKDLNCESNHTKRIFFRMPLSGVSGKYVESVEFTAFETHAYNCGNDTAIQLWHTSGFASTSTWNSTSDNWLTHLTSRDVSYCSRAPVEFGGGNLASVVRAAATRKDSTITFGLRAFSESTMDWWKRFDNDAYLKVQYNRPPNQPDTTKMFADPGTPCVDSPAAKWVNDEPTVNATLVDPDTEDAAKVQGQFQVSWDDGTGWGPKWTAPLTAAKTSGSRFSVKVPDGVLPRNTLMDWHVRAWDGIQWGPWSWAGAATGCYFYFDSTVPAEPAVTSADYPSDGDWHDGVGIPGVFTVDDPSNAAVRYEVKLNTLPLTTVTTTGGAPAQVTVRPTRSGPNLLTVQSFTAAGTPSAPATYGFDVKVGAPPVAHWKLDEAAGGTDVLGETPGIPAYLGGGATLGGAGPVGTALSLNGTDGYAATDLPVLKTTQSFSVAAWVRVRANDSHYNVISQDGMLDCAFQIGVDPNEGGWVMEMPPTDGQGGTRKLARVGTAAPLNTWTHLIGVYDASVRQMRLYVDGQPAATASDVTAWEATSGFQIGRNLSLSLGRHAGYWPGDIDDIKIFQDAVTDAEASELAQNTTPAGKTVLASWNLNETAGSKLVHGETGEIRASLGEGVTLGVDGQVGTAARFTGTTSYVATDRPMIDTTKSFSVSAWAKLAPGAETKNMSVASQEGTTNSGFSLKFNPTSRKWEFIRQVSDTTGAAIQGAFANTPADLGSWSHLVGVFDAQEQKLRLFVNGVEGTAHDFTTAWNATGRFQIGRSKSGGGQGSFFDGDVDDVRVFDRVVTAEEAKELYNQRPVLKGRWKLNTDGADDTGNGGALTLGGGAVVDPAAGFAGVSAGGLLLNQTAGYASTSAPVVDTAQSFTIAGWAQAAGRPQSAATVFSQAGANTNRFALRYVPGANPEEQGNFRLDMSGTDSATATHLIADHAGFTEGWWDHVAIVYDAPTDTMSLYVNGALEENETNVSKEGQVLGFTASNGGLQVGRSQLGAAEYWPGAIDDIWAYQGALSAEQIGMLAAFQELDTEFGP